MTTFDSLKKIEETRKKQVMAHLLNEIKDLAKEVLTSKKLVEKYLEVLTDDKKEQKQIIDWINSLPDTKLSEDDLKKIDEEVEEELTEEKKKVDKKMEQAPIYYHTAGFAADGTTTNNWNGASTLTLANTTCAVSDTGAISVQ